MTKVTYGTGCFLLMNTGEELVESRSGLLGTVALQCGGRRTYALEGSVFIGGAAIQWLRDGLGIIAEARDSAALAARVPASDGVYFVPALAGLGAPYWEPRACGAILGLTRGTTAAHIARATLEGIAFQVADLLGAVAGDAGVAPADVRADGGASHNDLLLQFQADVLGVPVTRAEHIGLELQKQVVVRSSAVGAHVRRRHAGVAGHGAQKVGHLEGDALERGPRDVCRGGAAREPEDRAAGARLPVRRAETGERGDEVHAVARRHARRQSRGIPRLGDDPETVAQPLDGRAADEHAALERVRAAAPTLQGDGAQQATLRLHGLLARVHQKKAAGAVGDLGHAARRAGLPEESGLLVPDHRRQGQGRPEDRGVGLPHDAPVFGAPLPLAAMVGD